MLDLGDHKMKGRRSTRSRERTDAKLGIVSMGEAKAERRKMPEIGVGMLGYAFMGKSHSNAFKMIPYMFWPPPAIPRLVAICGRNRTKVAVAAQRYGYSKYYTDWKDLANDPNVELFDNGAPNNLHAEPCIQAAENCKHILCEKPLARTAKEARAMVKAVRRSGVKHMVGFNYRFIPAIQVAKKLIEEKRIGRVYHFHARYLQEWVMNRDFPLVWRLDERQAGSGAAGDLGSHIVDLAHFLVGDIASVNAVVRTFIRERPLINDPDRRGKIDVDDAFESVIEFKNGAIGHISASRFCAGRKNYQHIEIYGEEGSISFNLERLNEIKVHLRHHDVKDLQSSFHDTLVTETYHPYWKNWWPHGLVIGWAETQVHEVYHFLDTIVNDKKVGPIGATFEDGYRCNLVIDTMLKSAETGRRLHVDYNL
jgi:predicted dehydrogenase